MNPCCPGLDSVSLAAPQRSLYADACSLLVFKLASCQAAHAGQQGQNCAKLCTLGARPLMHCLCCSAGLQTEGSLFDSMPRPNQQQRQHAAPRWPHVQQTPSAHSTPSYEVPNSGAAHGQHRQVLRPTAPPCLLQIQDAAGRTSVASCIASVCSWPCCHPCQAWHCAPCWLSDFDVSATPAVRTGKQASAYAASHGLQPLSMSALQPAPQSAASSSGPFHSKAQALLEAARAADPRTGHLSQPLSLSNTDAPMQPSSMHSPQQSSNRQPEHAAMQRTAQQQHRGQAGQEQPGSMYDTQPSLLGSGYSSVGQPSAQQQWTSRGHLERVPPGHHMQPAELDTPTPQGIQHNSRQQPHGQQQARGTQDSVSRPQRPQHAEFEPLSLPLQQSSTSPVGPSRQHQQPGLGLLESSPRSPLSPQDSFSSWDSRQPVRAWP